jgi:hypothetical protein
LFRSFQFIPFFLGHFNFINMNRDSFVFYRSFYEALKELPEKEKAQIFDAIASFSLDENIPELDGISKTIFILIKPQLEANNKKYINGKQPKNKQNISKKEVKTKQKRSKTEGNVNENVNVNVNENENENENSIPDFSNFKEYAILNKPNIDLIDLELKYKSWVANGWKDGHDNPIKKWKSKLLNTIPYIKETKPTPKPGLIKIELKRV